MYLSAQPAFACSKSPIETAEQCVKSVQSHWRRSGVFIVNFEQILHIALVFPILTMNK